MQSKRTHQPRTLVHQSHHHHHRLVSAHLVQRRSSPSYGYAVNIVLCYTKHSIYVFVFNTSSYVVQQKNYINSLKCNFYFYSHFVAFFLMCMTDRLPNWRQQKTVAETSTETTIKVVSWWIYIIRVTWVKNSLTLSPTLSAKWRLWTESVKATAKTRRRNSSISSVTCYSK